MIEYGPRERQCTYKRGYERRSEAKRVAKHTQRHPGQPAAPMKVYRCPYCNLWHVAHTKEARDAG